MGAAHLAATLAQGDLAAARAESNDRATAPHHLVCGAIVRLFKYLIPVYYDEFSLHWFPMLTSCSLCPVRQPLLEARALQVLGVQRRALRPYTVRGFPHRVCSRC